MKQLKITQVELFSFFHFMCVAAYAYTLKNQRLKITQLEKAHLVKGNELKLTEVELF